MPGNSCKDAKKPKLPNETDSSIDFAEEFIQLEREFVARLAPLVSGEKLKLKKNEYVEYVYNPLEYASELHNQYLRKYCDSTKKLLFLGMNPGPWGMCQTGVPFGEVNAVKDYLGITGEVEEPKKSHPKRKVEGLNCKRSEISGKRLWGLIAELSKNNPSVFFKDCFVYNYCPLAFMSATAKNITPAELKAGDQLTLSNTCDEFLLRVLKLLDTKIVIALGKYAEKRTLEVLEKHQVKDIKVYYVQHPSPLNRNSSNWLEDTAKCLKELGLIHYLQSN